MKKNVYLLALLLFVCSAASQDWVSLTPDGQNFDYHRNSLQVPIGLNEFYNDPGEGIYYLLPDTSVYNPEEAFSFLNNLDSHNLTVLRVFIENTNRRNKCQDGTYYYSHPIQLEDHPGSTEDTDNYSINSDNLTIITQRGDTCGQTAHHVKNLLLRPVDPPDADEFAITVKVHLPSDAENSNCAALFLYQDKDNYIRLSRHPSGVRFLREIDGQIEGDYIENLSSNQENVWLRISKTIIMQGPDAGKSAFKGSFSTNGTIWETFTDCNLNELYFVGMKSLVRTFVDVVPDIRLTETYFRYGISAFKDSTDESCAVSFDFVELEHSSGGFRDDFSGAIDPGWTFMSIYPATVKFWDDFIDYIESETANLYLMLSPWDTYYDFKYDRNEYDPHYCWNNCIYNSANGGPATNRLAWFTNTACQEDQRQRFEFMIDRWGNSPRIFAWELLNEMDLDETYWPNSNPQTVYNWIGLILDPVKIYESDLYGRNHLWTISTSSCNPQVSDICNPNYTQYGDIVYNDSRFNFSTTHFYYCGASPYRIADPKSNNGSIDVIEPALEVEEAIKYGLSKMCSPKPFFDSESGPIALTSVGQFIDEYCANLPGCDNYSSCCDKKYFHNMIWAHFSSGGKGSGIRWKHRNWWTEEMYDDWHCLSRISLQIDWNNFASENYDPFITCSDSQMHVMSSSDGQQGIIWLLSEQQETPVDAVVNCSQFQNENHFVYWFDDETGEKLGSSIQNGSSFTITSPEFTNHVVAIVRPIRIPSVVYVPTDAETIQVGIDMVDDGGTVIVRDGVYRGTGNRELDFHGKSITVRSANGADNCIIDCELKKRGFHFHHGEDLSSIVKGITIQNGDAECGGGLLCENSSSPFIQDCVIVDNRAWKGGGIYCTDGSMVVLEGCRFSGNSCTYLGAGICSEDAEPQIYNCEVSDNAGWFCGAGIYLKNYHSFVSNCIVTGNHCDYGTSHGGGIGAQSSNFTIENCLITGNSLGAYSTGSAIWTHMSQIGIKNSTIADNYHWTGLGKAIEVGFASAIDITDSIVWDNNPIDLPASGLAVQYSDVEVAQGVYPGTGNINEDPLFLEEYYLSEDEAGQGFDSPCIDTGSDLSDQIAIQSMDGLIHLSEFTTNLSKWCDKDQVDIGYHTRGCWSWPCSDNLLLNPSFENWGSHSTLAYWKKSSLFLNTMQEDFYVFDEEFSAYLRWSTPTVSYQLSQSVGIIAGQSYDCRIKCLDNDSMTQCWIVLRGEWLNARGLMVGRFESRPSIDSPEWQDIEVLDVVAPLRAVKLKFIIKTGGENNGSHAPNLYIDSAELCRN